MSKGTRLEELNVLLKQTVMVYLFSQFDDGFYYSCFHFTCILRSVVMYLFTCILELSSVLNSSVANFGDFFLGSIPISYIYLTVVLGCEELLSLLTIVSCRCLYFCS